MCETKTTAAVGKAAALLQKLRSSDKLRGVLDLLTGKYLYFFTLAVLTLCTAPQVLNSVSMVDFLVYYALPQDGHGYYPNTLFGIFSFGFGDLGTVSMILKGAYLVLLVLLTLIVTVLLRRVGSITRRLELLALAAFWAIMLTSADQFNIISNFNFNAMLSAVLTGFAVLAAFSGRAPVLALSAVLVGAAQAVDCRTILFVAPAAVTLFIFAKSLTGRSRFLRAACLCAVLSAGVMLCVTQFLSLQNNVDFDEVYTYITENQASGQTLESINITGWYGSTVFRWLEMFVPPLNDVYGILRATVNKNNLVLLTIAFCAAYLIALISAAKREHRSVRAALTGLFRTNGDDRFTKLTFAALLTCIVYIDLIVPCVNFPCFLVIAFSAAVFFLHEKDKLHISVNIIGKPVFFISLALLSLKYVLIAATRQLSDYSYIHAYLSYQDFGFIPRALAGSILRVILGEYVPLNTMFTAMFICKMLLVAVLLLLVLWLMNMTKGENRIYTGFLVLAMFASPAVSGFFEKDTSYYIDMFFVIPALLCIALAVKNNASVWLIPLLCALCMLMHHVFICTAFPAVFSVLAFRTCVVPQGHRARGIAVTLLSITVCAVIFFWFIFFPNIPDITPEAMLKTMLDRSDVIQSDISFTTGHALSLIKYGFLDVNHEHTTYFHSMIRPYMIVNTLSMAASFFPVSLMYFRALKHSSESESDRLAKWGYFIIGLSLIVILPLFISEIDYGRWVSYHILCVMLPWTIITAIQPEGHSWHTNLSPKFTRTLLTAVLLICASFSTLQVCANYFNMFTL